MKASEFKDIIKEAVREAIREEFSTMKTPTPPPTQLESLLQAPKPQSAPFSGGNPLLEALNMTSRTMTSEDYRNVGTGTADMAQMFNRSTFAPRQSIKPSSVEPTVVAQAIASAPKVGLDISQLGFINKAAAIVQQADKKVAERNGL
jgi:hypothetical protein